MAFEKVLLRKNQGAIDNEIFQLQPKKVYFQSFVDRLKTIGVIAADNDLEQLVNSPKAYVTDKLTAGEEMKVGGLKLNKEKLFDLIDKPAGTNEIIKDIEKDQSDKSIREYTHWLANRFTVTAGVVEITAGTMDNIHARNSLFITSENQQQAFNKLTEFVDVVNQLNELQHNNGGKIAGSSEMENYIRYDQTTGAHTINLDALARFK
jgi:hypothetical protein